MHPAGPRRPACFIFGLPKEEPALVSALRTRAVEWCREFGITDYESCLLITGSISLAYLRSAGEQTGLNLLSSVAADRARGG